MYRDLWRANGERARVRWTKRINGRRPTKRDSQLYWAARQAELAGLALGDADMAKAKSNWNRVPSSLNIWKPKKANETLTILVTDVGTHKFAPEKEPMLQVSGIEPDGTQWTLPGHAVLESRLRWIMRQNKLTPGKTVLRVEYIGKEKGKQAQPMEVYEVDFRPLEAEDVFNL